MIDLILRNYALRMYVTDCDVIWLSDREKRKLAELGTNATTRASRVISKSHEELIISYIYTGRCE